MTIFDFALTAPPPPLRIDRREIIAADFMAPQMAWREAISPFLRAYLERFGSDG